MPVSSTKLTDVTVAVADPFSTTPKHPVPRVSGAVVSEDSIKGDLNGSPALLTIEDVAALLRTTKKAIYTMKERGLLPGGVRVGRRLLVRRSALAQWLDQNRVPSPKEGVRR